MQLRLIDRLTTWRALLLVLAAGAGVYALMPSCLGFVPDEDDTLCHALDAAENGIVDWPDDETHLQRGGPGVFAFDHAENNPWYGDGAACAYMDGFLAGGDGWGEMGHADPMSVNGETGVIDTPIGRTYNAYANLIYSGSSAEDAIQLDRSRPLDDWSYYDSFLKWSVAFVHHNTFRVNPSCRRDCTYESCEIGQCKGQCCIARTVKGTTARQQHVDLYQTFFYDIDSVWRASTLVHEVRHARKGCQHDGGAGCPRDSSCDRRWSRAGANTYEVMWLAAFTQTHRVSPARRARAEARLDYMLREAFVDTPRWNKQSFGFVNMTPDFYVELAACSEDPSNPHRCLELAN